MQSRSRLSRWLVCSALALLAPAFASTGVGAAAAPTPTAAAVPSEHVTPFAPLTTKDRSKTPRRPIKRGGKAPLTLLGRTTSAGATMGGQKSAPSSSTRRRNAPLSSPPPPELPDDLTSFAGTSQASAIHSFGPDQEVTPPNEDIAVGPTDVVEVVNSTVYVFSRTGAVLGSDDLNVFMGVPPGYHSSDPRVMYDGNPDNGGPPRFWITVSEVPDSFSPCPTAAGVLIAVSPSSNPLPFADWLVYELPIGLDTPGTSFGDQPGLSVGTDIVTVTFDDFDCNLNFLGSEIDIIQKTDLIQDAGITPLVFFYDGPFAPQPVQASDEVETVGSPVYVVTNESDCGSVACTNPAVEADIITGDPEAGNVTLFQSFDAMSPTAVNNSTGLLPPAQQKGTSLTLQTNDDRFLNAVLSVNGSIWAADGTTCIPPGDTVERACLDVVNFFTGNAVSQINNVGVAGASLFYPAVGVDANGDMFTVFDESSTTMFPTMLDATVTDVGYPPVLSSFQTLHTSSTYYNGDDLFVGACDSEGCRWGDYSGVAQDPLNTNDVWVVSGAEDGVTGGACTTIHACWNTDISELTVSPPTITAVNPSVGPVVGGQKVTVTGFDFGSETTVTFNGSPVAVSNLTPTSFTFITPPDAPSGGTVQTQATNAFGSSAEGQFTSYVYEGLANFVPVTPYRIYDSRADPYGPLGPGETRTLLLLDLSPIPTNATAVVLNVTAINGSASSYLTLFPYDTPRPNASNLNFAAHTVVANLVTVDLANTDIVNMYNALGAVNVAVDVEGYFIPQPASDLEGLFHPVSPVRVCDTRPGSPTPACAGRTVTAGVPLVVNVTGGAGAIPNDGTAAAAVLNVTGVAGTAGTFISVFPTSSNGTCAYSGTNQPKISTLNLVAGAVQANRVMVELGPAHTGGPSTSVCVYSPLGRINILLDVNGWFGSATATSSTPGYQYQAIGPIRICDTRVASAACSAGAIAGNLNRLITVAGAGGVPAVGAGTVAVAIIANLTAVTPTQNTYLTLYPASLAVKPLVSDINVNSGAVLPNLAVVELGIAGNAHAGAMNIYNSVGSVNAIVDLEGWFQ